MSSASAGCGLPSRVLFGGYAVCQDYSLDAGRLYRTRGGSGGWTLLGQGAWVYPDPDRLRVSIEGVDKSSIELSERELDAMDALQFSRKLNASGYSVAKGSAWYFLDYVREAYAQGVAVTPFGVRSARVWPASIFGAGAGARRDPACTGRA